MNYVNNITVFLIFIGVIVLFYVQWKKSKEAQNIYKELNDEQKKYVDDIAPHNPRMLLYGKPMTRGMIISVAIGVIIFIAILIEEFYAL